MKKKSLIIIIISALALILVVGVALLLVLGNKPKVITITFNTDGGDKIESIKVKADEKVKLPNAQKLGYTFEGWYLNNKKLDSEASFKNDTVIVAKYSKVEKKDDTIELEFNTNEGEPIKSITVECGKPIPELPIPKREGYDFISWTNKDSQIVSKGYTITCDNKTYSLIANWEEQTKKFKVTFDSNGGSKVDPVEVVCDEELKLPKAPTKTDYTFVRWEDKNGTPVYDKAILSCEDITVKAVWEKIINWKCPSSSYKLVEKNGKWVCTTTGSIKSESCASGTKADGDICVRLSDKASGQNSCPKKQITTPGGSKETVEGVLLTLKTGETSMAYLCGYHRLDSYPTETTCTNAGGKWTVYGTATTKGCYVETTSPQVQCPGSYRYYSSSDLSSKFGVHDNGSCFKIEDKTKTCFDGFVLENGTCTQTVDATEG